MVPENINTHPTEGHWKIQGGGGRYSKTKILKEKYEAKLGFPEGWGGSNQQAFHGGGMDFF